MKKRLYSIILCTVMLAVVCPLSLTAYAADEDPSGEMLDQVIVMFFDRSNFPGKEKQYDDEVAKVVKDGLSVVANNVYVVKAEGLSKNPNAILNKYKNSKFIAYAEPNFKGAFSATPNDPNYTTLKALLTAINAQNGWDIVKNGGPPVAVVDSGVYQHPDLPKLLPGYSAVAGLSPNNDTVGHGTGVAGTLGAIGNNGIGTVGMNWGANIMPVKVDDASGTLSVANIAKGIMWAADNGAKIINLSLGTSSDSVTLKNAVDYAYNKGCALFAATGNDGVSTISYPARYSNVMAVGATSNGTSRASISSYGTGMGVVAISSYTTTTAQGGYAGMGGTSFAAPQVSGLASLVLALNPGLTNEQVYSYIQQGAKPLGGGYNNETGYGVIDLGKTLALVRDSVPAEVIDTTAPVLTLAGSLVMEIRQGEKFTEPGYTAIDDIDGNITSKVVVTGTVNVNTPGVYRLEYKVSDAAGNTAEATRVVEVVLVDDTPPVLTLKGSQTMEIRQGEAFIEPGYTATDNIDGDITGKVVVSGAVNVNVPGHYTLEYSVSDAAGNKAAATRAVNVVLVDNTPPVLTLKGSSEMEIRQGEAFIEPGYTAIDNVDGDITSKVDVTGLVNSNVPSRYILEYSVSDTAGNTSTATRSVNVAVVAEEPKYLLPPTITLSGSMDVQIFTSEDYTEPGYSAVDCLGASLTGAVRVTDNIDHYTEGLYTVDYVVEDAGGNTARATRTVIVADREVPPPPANAPKLTIIGSDPIILHLDSGTPYQEQGAYAYDEADGDISEDVQIAGNVNRGKEGTYTLTYTVANSAGLVASATRDVRILAPSEAVSPRQAYNFSGQGKAPTTITHTGVIVEEAGWMDFAVTKIDNKVTINVAVKKDGEEVFGGTYAGMGGTQFWVDEGTYSASVTIAAGNGNCSYGVRLTTPETIFFVFEDEEVPLALPDDLLGDLQGGLPSDLQSDLPKTGNNGSPPIMVFMLWLSVAGSISALIIGRKRSIPK
ncbi:MAG: DUF5011 domain-containing protein [Clostridiales bacterium]|nr:DUF5011 domain-containing protein [Clostridiales bacterium]